MKKSVNIGKEAPLGGGNPPTLTFYIILIIEYFIYFSVLTFLIIFLIIPYTILIFSDTLKKRHQRDVYFYKKFNFLEKKITKLTHS